MPLPADDLYIEKISTKEEISEKLREWIITLTFAPGEKITDTDIAAYFHVSRTPVREVLKVLEQQKLIVTYPGRATVVAELNPDKVEEIYVPMRSLQCLAVRLAVENVREGDLEELRALNESFYAKMQVRRENALELLMADRAFHQKLVDMAQNEYINDFCGTLWTHVSRLDYLFFRDTEMLRDSYNDHQDIINALQLRDTLGAELAMQNNWTNSMLGIQALIRQNYN